MKYNLKIKLKEDSDKVEILKNSKADTIHNGIVIKLFKKSACIMTPIGEFIKIKTNRKVMIGELIHGKEPVKLGKYKIHIAITLMILMMISCATVIDYRKTVSIIIVETTSNIKIHVNKYGKVIYTYSPTEKGKALISNINFENENIDDVIEQIFEYAFSNKMIDTNKKVLITVSGKSLEYGSLSKTNKFISENKISIVINNSGNEQKMPEYISE